MPAFDLPGVSSPGALTVVDAAGELTVPASQWVKGANNNWAPVGANNPMPVGSSAVGAVAVTPNDTINLGSGITKGIYLGGTGNVAVVMANDSEVIWTALAAGMIHPISVKRVKATGTTATSILAVY